MLWREMQRTLRARVPIKPVREQAEHRPTERQVAEMLAERRETRDDLAVHPKRRDAIGDALLRVRDDPENHLTQLLKRYTLSLLDRPQIRVDLLSGHRQTVSESRQSRHHLPDHARHQTLARAIQRDELADESPEADRTGQG